MIMHDPHVYIVVLNYLQWTDTRDCLESLLQSTYTNYSILVIDNNSPNHSLKQLFDWADGKMPGYKKFNAETFNAGIDLTSLPVLTFVQNDKNSGFAAGNNLALRLLSNQDAYIWLLNPDMTIREDTLAALVHFTIQQPEGSIVGAEVRTWSGNHELLFYGGGRVRFSSATVQLVKETDSIKGLDYISGGSLFTHASSFKKYGLLPEEYFLYWEETDWCFRAKKQGALLLVCREAICYDKISTVIGKGYLADYYYSRNGLLFISKFRKRNIPVALMINIVRMLKRIITGQWGRARGVFKGTIDFLKKKFNAIQ